jgi:SAM-dependent methyltransferase
VTRDEAESRIVDAVCGPSFRRATFAGAKRGPAAGPWVRASVRPVAVRGETLLQVTWFDGRKTDVKNVASADAGPVLRELLALGFSGVHVDTADGAFDVRLTKKGGVTFGRGAASPAGNADTSHNRVKDQPLPEGRADRLLELLGLATADGRVKPTMRAKFTQVNEFLRHLAHAIDDAKLTDLGRPLDLLDCGCGSSYLTFAAHHYLNDVRNIPARILGVDVNEGLIRGSVAKAGHLGTGDVNFQTGTIGRLDAKPDVVLALHACDTATDDAIIQAIRSDAAAFLGVPCCHRHLNRQLKPDGVNAPALRHGLLRERQADLLTDTFRALALKIAGYKTDVVEFVSPDVTAKNLMIRAVRGGPKRDPAAVAEFAALKAFWKVEPYVERAIA